MLFAENKDRIMMLKDQPAFPNEDLTADNADVLDYHLAMMGKVEAGMEHYMQTMRTVYRTAHSALVGIGIDTSERPAEYAAFCHGYATFDVMLLMVNMAHPREYDMELAARRFREMFLQSEELADLELAMRRAAWVNSYPNTFDVAIKSGTRRGETMSQLQARTMGTQIAHDMQTQ